MTNVRMKAINTLHVSSVSAHSMVAGTEFEVSGHLAEDLESRGLAERVAEAKAAPAPQNKAAQRPANKAGKAN